MKIRECSQYKFVKNLKILGVNVKTNVNASIFLPLGDASVQLYQVG